MSPSALPVRAGDPDTFLHRRESALGRVLNPAVLALIRDYDPLTDDELIADCRMRVVLECGTPCCSECGIRTWLTRLAQAGLVVTDEKCTSNVGDATTGRIAADLNDDSA